MTFSRVCQKSGKAEYKGRQILVFWEHAQEMPGGKPEIRLNLAHQISAAWPCHGWDSSRWLPAYPLQYSGLENSLDWIGHGVAKSRTWLSMTSDITLFTRSSVGHLTYFLLSIFWPAGSQREESHLWQGHAAEIWWARRVKSQGFPLVFPKHVPPKTKVCRPLYSAFPLFWHILEKVNSEL